MTVPCLPAELLGPEGVCCVGSRVFVCDRPAHQMVVFDASNVSRAERRFGHNFLNEPTAVVACGELLFISTTSSSSRPISSALWEGVAGTPAQHAGSIVVCRLDGAFVRRITHTLLREARGLTFVNGHLVATDYNSYSASQDRVWTRLLVFTPTGELRQVLEDDGGVNDGGVKPASSSPHKQWRSFYGCAVVGNGELHIVDAGALVIRAVRTIC